MRCTILSYFTFHNGELTIRFRQGHSNIVKVLARQIIYGETPSLHRILRKTLRHARIYTHALITFSSHRRRTRFRRRRQFRSRGWRRRKYVRRRRRHRNRFNYWRFRAIKHDHLTWNATTGLATLLTFLLSDVTYPKGYWDYYKIKKVVVQLWPESGPVPINREKNIILYGSSVIDYDDSTLSTTTTDPYKDYSSRKLFIHNRPHIRVFTARPSVELYKSASVSNYGFLNANVGPWINAVHDSVPHYGLKIWLPPNTSGPGAISFKLIIKYYITFRNRL
ncbi:hypothetical protein M9458_051928 [Cirrhinus mrigala]|uniref:Capsid protein n=1 Tax=Cirrhinus mrigala TaxID=683832 RepID=A0ABD0MT81_CIRMR